MIEDAVLAASGDLIVYAGPASGFDHPPGPGTVEFDARGAAVIPGFVDAHTHLVWLGDRSEEYALRAAEPRTRRSRNGGRHPEHRRRHRRGHPGGADDRCPGARPSNAAVGHHHGRDQERLRPEPGGGAAPAPGGARTGTEPDMPDVVPPTSPSTGFPTAIAAAYLEGVLEEGLAAAASLAGFVDCFCEIGAWDVDECERLLGAARAPA